METNKEKVREGQKNDGAADKCEALIVHHFNRVDEKNKTREKQNRQWVN